jgi:hypothetical protein
LEIAVQVAREVCDLPIVASMTFAEDGRDRLAVISPHHGATKRQTEAGAHVRRSQLHRRSGPNFGD